MKAAELQQQIVILEEKIENLERRNRMLANELDSRRINKHFTPEEVADILRVSYQTILKDIKCGKLGTYQIGNKYRIAPKHLASYLNTLEK